MQSPIIVYIMYAYANISFWARPLYTFEVKATFLFLLER